MNPTQQLYEAAKKIQTWIITHPKKATIVRYVIDEFNNAITAYEQSTEHPAAYEFHNLTTGHCYVDYVPRIDMDEKDGYTKTPLYK